MEYYDPASGDSKITAVADLITVEKSPLHVRREKALVDCG